MQESREMQVPSLGREDTLEEGPATHCSILAWESHGQRKPGGVTVYEVTLSQTVLKGLNMHTSYPQGIKTAWVYFFFFWCGLFLKPLLNLLQHCFCCMFWFPGHEASGILTPWPGIEPKPPALEGKVSTLPSFSSKFHCILNLSSIKTPVVSYFLDILHSIDTHSVVLTLRVLLKQNPSLRITLWVSKEEANTQWFFRKQLRKLGLKKKKFNWILIWLHCLSIIQEQT